MHEIGIEWMTQTEVNGHFLELRGIPDEKLEWERIPEAIAGANYYNIQNRDSLIYWSHKIDPFGK